MPNVLTISYIVFILFFIKVFSIKSEKLWIFKFFLISVCNELERKYERALSASVKKIIERSVGIMRERKRRNP